MPRVVVCRSVYLETRFFGSEFKVFPFTAPDGESWGFEGGGRGGGRGHFALVAVDPPPPPQPPPTTLAFLEVIVGAKRGRALVLIGALLN